MKIVGFGDSITYGALVGETERFMHHLQEMFPAETFVNAGVPGNTSTQGKARLESEVLAEKPGIGIIFFGMNDCVCDRGVDTPAVSREEYRDNLRYFAKCLQGIGCKLIYCTIPPVIEGDATQYYYSRHPQENYRHPAGVNAWLAEYSAIVKEVAQEVGAETADVQGAFAAYAASGGTLHDLMITLEHAGVDDGVHPNAAGHRLIAETIAPKVKRFLMNP